MLKDGHLPDLDSLQNVLKRMSKDKTLDAFDVEERLKPYVQIDTLMLLCDSYKNKRKSLVLSVTKSILTLLCKFNCDDALDLYFCNMLFLLDTDVASPIPKLFKESCSVISLIKTPNFLQREAIVAVAQKLDDFDANKGAPNLFLPISLRSFTESSVAPTTQSLPSPIELHCKGCSRDDADSSVAIYHSMELLSHPISPSLFVTHDATGTSASFQQEYDDDHLCFDRPLDTVDVTCTGPCNLGLDGRLTISGIGKQALKVVNGRIRGKMTLFATFKESPHLRKEFDAISCLSEAANELFSSSEEDDSESSPIIPRASSSTDSSLGTGDRSSSSTSLGYPSPQLSGDRLEASNRSSTGATKSGDRLHSSHLNRASTHQSNSRSPSDYRSLSRRSKQSTPLSLSPSSHSAGNPNLDSGQKRKLVNTIGHLLCQYNRTASKLPSECSSDGHDTKGDIHSSARSMPKLVMETTPVSMAMEYSGSVKSDGVGRLTSDSSSTERDSVMNQVIAADSLWDGEIQVLSPPEEMFDKGPSLLEVIPGKGSEGNVARQSWGSAREYAGVRESVSAPCSTHSLTGEPKGGLTWAPLVPKNLL